VWTLAAYRRTCGPSWLAWSQGRRPLALFYIRRMNRVNSRNGCAMTTLPRHCCHYYYYYLSIKIGMSDRFAYSATTTATVSVGVARHGRSAQRHGQRRAAPRVNNVKACYYYYAAVLWAALRVLRVCLSVCSQCPIRARNSETKQT